MIHCRRLLMFITAFLLSSLCISAYANPFALAEGTAEPFADGFDLCGTHYSIDVEEIDLSDRSLLDAKDIDILRQIAQYTKNLKNINLGFHNCRKLFPISISLTASAFTESR